MTLSYTHKDIIKTLTPILLKSVNLKCTLIVGDSPLQITS